MIVAQLLLLLCSIQVILSVPTRPQISSSFSSAVRLTIDDADGEHVGVGIWAVNQPSMGLESYKFDDDKYDTFNLQRYDLGMQYVLDPMNTNHCRSFDVNGTMPQVWDWVSLLSFVGESTYNNKSIDVWESRIGYAYLQLAVSSNDTTTPVVIFRSSRGERNSTYEFLDWNSNSPDDKFFSVPSVCNTNSKPAETVGCTIARSTIIAKAKVWVANHVPYNQGGTYQGYREDCSGYVSMCWASTPPGHSTSTMHEIAHQITKAELLPGDCLLFAAYEETRPGEGTVTRATPYPYWYSQSSFIPFRYNDVC